MIVAVGGLSWTASTDNVGVTGYLVERCVSAACVYAQIATPTATSYNDTTAVASHFPASRCTAWRR